FADFTSFLNFNKCANLCIVADFTTIKISEVINSNAYTQLDIRSNFCIHCCLHLCLPASQPKAVQPAGRLVNYVCDPGSCPGPVCRSSSFLSPKKIGRSIARARPKKTTPPLLCRSLAMKPLST